MEEEKEKKEKKEGDPVYSDGVTKVAIGETDATEPLCKTINISVNVGFR